MDRNQRGGFTLLELILVMVIISILAGSVVFNVAGRGTEARIARARMDLSVYQRAVEAYALENNDKYPQRLSDLVTGKKKYVIEVKKDAWANPYEYACPGKNHPYEMFSRGPDGQAGTEDDISVWEEK